MSGPDATTADVSAAVALARHRGPATQLRHAGATHDTGGAGPAQRGQGGSHGSPGHAGGTSAGQHARAAHPARQRRPTARVAAGLIELGVVQAYDAASNRAWVALRGTINRLVGPLPVADGAPTAAIVGAACLVVALDAHNPTDGVVAAVWPAMGPAVAGPATQSGVATIGIAGASQASAVVTFPRAYGWPPIVVATSTDPAWTATVSAVTATGYTLTLRAAALGTATIGAAWIASGV